MKCILAQAGQATGEWLSLAASGSSGSRCCTYIPVSGHLNRIGQVMRGRMPEPTAHQNSGCLLRYLWSRRTKPATNDGNRPVPGRSFVLGAFRPSCAPIKIGPDISAAMPADLADELRLDIGKANNVGPMIAADPD